MSFNRKAFTLVEVSATLLVVSALISTLLTVRGIIYSAKAHKIITEFQNIRNSIGSFYANFSQLPGNLDYQVCLESLGQNACSNDNEQNNLFTVVAAKGTRKSNIYAMRQLALFNRTININDLSSQYNDVGYVSYSDVKNFYIKSYLGKNLYWSLSPNENIRGLRKEFESPSFSRFDKYSKISIFYNIEESCQFLDGSACENGLAAIPAKIAYSIDWKIDDGLPYNGNVIATKPPIAQNNSTIEDIKTYCTTLNKKLDNTANINSSDIASSEYQFNDANSLIKGCNLTFLYLIP
jgi:hypothetical protein